MAPARWTGKRSVAATGTSGRGSAVDTGPDATDAAKALADEHGIDLATVEGTGAEGRVTKDDVSALIDEGDADAA